MRLALFANFVVGAALVIAMVDVPLFVNAVEVDLERSAVVAGWVLSVLTAAMAVASYVGGRLTERTWYGPPVLLGLALPPSAYLAMGLTWDADTSYVLIAVQLAVLGAGFGLDRRADQLGRHRSRAAPTHRGAAAALVMVVRLLGLQRRAVGAHRVGAGPVQQPAPRHRPPADHRSRLRVRRCAPRRRR